MVLRYVDRTPLNRPKCEVICVLYEHLLTGVISVEEDFNHQVERMTHFMDTRRLCGPVTLPSAISSGVAHGGRDESYTEALQPTFTDHANLAVTAESASVSDKD